MQITLTKALDNLGFFDEGLLVYSSYSHILHYVSTLGTVQFLLQQIFSQVLKYQFDNLHPFLNFNYSNKSIFRVIPFLKMF